MSTTNEINDTLFKGFRVRRVNLGIRLEWFDDDHGWTPGVFIARDFRISVLPPLQPNGPMLHNDVDTLHRALHAALLFCKQHPDMFKEQAE